MKSVALAFALGAALALPALADDVVAPATDVAAVVPAAQLDPVLDVAIVVTAAAGDTNALGMTRPVTTGIIFFVVAVTLFTVMTDGPASH